MLSSLVQSSCWKTELPASHLQMWMKDKQGKYDLKHKLFPVQVSSKTSLGGWGDTEVEKAPSSKQNISFLQHICTYTILNPTPAILDIFT